MGNEHGLTEAQIEEIAREIYARFEYLPGWVPWVPGGNSNMQITARRSAIAALAVIRPMVIREAADAADELDRVKAPDTKALRNRAAQIAEQVIGEWITANDKRGTRELMARAAEIALLDLAERAQTARNDALREAAAWHSMRARETPDAFEMELHCESEAAIFSLIKEPTEAA